MTATPSLPRRTAGVLLHVTSLPGPYGIGDLGPAAHDWVRFLAQAGQHWWQLLPLGPTGYADSPYQSLSAFAGNLNLLSPEALVADGLLAEITEASQMMSPSFRTYHDIYERRAELARDGEADPERELFWTYAAVMDKDVRQAVALAAERGVELPAAIALQGRGAETYAVQ